MSSSAGRTRPAEHLMPANEWLHWTLTMEAKSLCPMRLPLAGSEVGPEQL